jgi:hypothetical protein
MGQPIPGHGRPSGGVSLSIYTHGAPSGTAVGKHVVIFSVWPLDD